MDKYCIYLRKSRADLEAEKLGEGETLARHKQILTELAVRKGLYIEKIYHEIVSGETIAARPQMQNMIHDCYNGLYRGIVVVDVDRLSRGNQGDMQTIMDMLRYANNRTGLLVITPTKTYDVAHNYDDEEYIEFVLFMSRREYKTIQKRLDRGRKQSVVEGNFMGSYRPYGYQIFKTKASRTLVPDEQEAPVVQKIFRLTVEENLSPGEIARKLTIEGVPTYRGGSEWSVATIKTILTNPVYTGKVRWNDRIQIKTMVDGKLKKSRPRSNHTEQYMLHEGKHKALITQDTFEQAAKRFTSDRTKANVKLINPLATLLYCKKCGKAMAYAVYRKDPNKRPRYNHCQSVKCTVKSAAAEDVMNAVVYALRQYIEDFTVKIEGQHTTDEAELQEELKVLQREETAIKKKLSKLFDAWESGLLTDNEFVSRKAEHTKRIDAIKAEVERLENTIPEKEELEEKIMAFSDALKALQDDTLSAADKNKFLKSIIDKIYFSRENNDEFILDISIK